MKRQPINKDNYEEYFLLYVDNELTAEEITEVDSFIAKNPGLKMELQMFLDTRLDLEDVKMDGLEELYRYEDGLVNKDNYEEFQVLMIDNEIGSDQKKALETYHEANKEALANFEWLKKTKLPEETIVFPDKSSLYRTEKKPATVISISWFRYAAAAVVLVLAGLLWINIDNDEIAEGIDQPIAQVPASSGSKKEDSSKTGTAIPDSNTNSGSAIEETEDANVNVQTKINALAVTETPVTAATRPGSQKDRTAHSDRTPEKDMRTEPDQQQIAAVEKNETKIRTEDLMSQQTNETFAAPAPHVQPAVARNVKTNYAAEALNGNADDDDESAFIQEESKQRKGLRSIVRKANRIYNKVTNPDLDKPLVKVANLEIGLQR
jgi:hypothetical protein